ncbi:MAG: hypothetical protein KAI47_22895 [Deltaproteobacteria bacterium]|nr:hypothetical protein [Deltaproteobacteria bacterium]
MLALLLFLVKALPLIAVALIAYDAIIDWFASRNAIKMADKANIAFTLKEKLDSGNYKVVQGIFNKRDEQIVDSRAVNSASMDKKIMHAHRHNELVLYE